MAQNRLKTDQEASKTLQEGPQGTPNRLPGGEIYCVSLISCVFLLFCLSGLKSVQDGPRDSQDRPKAAPEIPQTASRRPKRAPRWPKRRPRRA